MAVFSTAERQWPNRTSPVVVSYNNKLINIGYGLE